MKLLKLILLSIVLSVLALYIADDLSVRFRIPSSRDPFGTVRVQPYYAVPQKDHKTEFIFAEPQTEVCVHSIFPHQGHCPCWYTGSKKQKRIDM
jgi:hypothetical protein